MSNIVEDDRYDEVWLIIGRVLGMALEVVIARASMWRRAVAGWLGARRML